MAASFNEQYSSTAALHFFGRQSLQNTLKTMPGSPVSSIPMISDGYIIQCGMTLCMD